jgi:hypothetical protein
MIPATNQTRNFRIEEKVYRELKAHAALNGLTIGGQIRALLDQVKGRPNYRTKEYAEWIREVCRIGREGGDQAAQEYIAQHPAPMGW